MNNILSKFQRFLMPFLGLLAFLLSCQSDTISTISPIGLQFLVVGDWGRNGTQNQQQVANQMNRTAQLADAQFVISTGDNFYESGVANINDSQWKTSFEVYIRVKVCRKIGS